MENWISLSQTAGTGNATISISASSYSELMQRATSLTVATRTRSAVVNVIQEMQDTFFITPSSLVFKGSESKELTVTSDKSWTATTIPSFLTISPSSGSGSMTITVTSSSSVTEDMEGEIIFENADGYVRTVPVSYTVSSDYYVVCTYETTEPNQVIPLFGQYTYNIVGGSAAPYTQSCRYIYPDTVIRSHYMTDIQLTDGHHYSEDYPETSEYSDKWVFPNPGIHTVKMRFPEDVIETNGAASFRLVGDAQHGTKYILQVPFALNPYLKTIYIPEGVTLNDTGLMVGLFESCTNLDSITCEAEGFFKTGFAKGCTSLSYFSVPDGEEIPDSAFSGCTSLPKLSFSGVTKIGNYAFANCPNFSGAIELNNCALGDYIFLNDTGITSVSVINCTTSGENAFNSIGGELYVDYCTDGWFECGSNFTKIVWGPNREILAWYGRFPATMTEWEWQRKSVTGFSTAIWPGPFSDCSGLTKITVWATNQFDFGQGGHIMDFEGVANNGTLYHPRGSDYSGWMSNDEYWLGYYNWSSVEFDFPPDEISIDDDSSIYFPAYPSSVTRVITSNVPWSCRITHYADGGWQDGSGIPSLSVTPSSGSEGVTTITIAVSEMNTSGNDYQNTRIHFSGGTAEEIVLDDIRQIARSLDLDYDNRLDEYTAEIPFTGGTIHYTVKTNQAWAAGISYGLPTNMVSISQTGGTASGDTYEFNGTVTAPLNTGQTYSGEIRFNTIPDDYYALVQSIVVYYYGKEDRRVTNAQSKTNIPVGGGSYSLTAYTTVPLIIEADSWISVSPSTAGPESQIITANEQRITVTAVVGNNTGPTRTGYIYYYDAETRELLGQSTIQQTGV